MYTVSKQRYIGLVMTLTYLMSTDFDNCFAEMMQRK